MSRSKKKSKIDLKSEQLLREIEAFRRKRWERLLPRDRTIALEIEKVPERIYVVRTEEDPGDEHLFILFGEESYTRFRAFWFDERWTLFDSIHFFETCFLPAADVEPPFFRIHQAAGRTYPPAQQIPCIVAKEPGHTRRGLRGAEIRLATAALKLLHNGLTAIDTLPDSAGVDHDAEPPRVLLRLRGNERGKLVESDHWELPDELIAAPIAHQVSLPDNLADLPRTEHSLAICTFTPGGMIENDERLTTFILAFDELDGVIVNALLHQGTATDIPGELWGTILRGEEQAEGTDARGGLPKALRFEDPELFDSVSASLALLGIDAELDPDHPSFQDIEDFIAGLGEHLVDAFEESDEVEGDDEDQIAAIRAPRTLVDWKMIDKMIVEFNVEEAHELDNENTRRRYFGQPEFPERAIELFGPEAVVGAYFDWLTHDLEYVRGRGPARKTSVERWITDPRTPAPVKKLLRARRDAHASLFRVHSIEPGSHTSVVDVITNDFHRLEDAAFSDSVVVGSMLFLRLIRIAEWTFIGIAGPPLPKLMPPDLSKQVDRVVDLFATEGRARGIEEAGKLWVPLSEPLPLPELVNTAGHPIKVQTLRYSVTDADSVENTLDHRRDLSRDDDQVVHSMTDPKKAPVRATYTWFDRKSKNAQRGELPEALGVVRLGEDFLEVDTDSNRRAGRAKQWLNRIAGVRLEMTTVYEPPKFVPTPDAEDGEAPTANPSASTKKGPGATASEEFGEEMLEDIQSRLVPVLRQQLMGWIDEKIPALENRTPREAVATAEGRRRVATLIHSMSPPVTGGLLEGALDFEAIRSAMLRELRLDRGVEGGE